MPRGSGELLTDETGCVIHNRDLDTVLREVQKAACRDEPWPESVAAALRVLAQRHAWDTAAGRLAALYRELANVERG